SATRRSRVVWRRQLEIEIAMRRLWVLTDLSHVGCAESSRPTGNLCARGGGRRKLGPPYTTTVFAFCFIVFCLYHVRADSPTDDADQTQRLLEKWHDDPAYYAWLKQGLTQFLALPPERQERMRALDKAIREEDSASSVRLLRVMDRYADWLRRLPDADRQRIEAAANSAERLRIIKDLREREWVERLPRTTREELEKLPDDRRRTRIAELKKEERTLRESWQTAARHWEDINRQRPQTVQLQQLDSEIRTFVTAHLLPLLDRRE